MAQDYSETAALKLAKEAVARLEKSSVASVGYIDRNKVMGGLEAIQSNNPISRFPSSDEIFKQRVAELAGAYAKVSDGNGGIMPKQAVENMRKVTDAMGRPLGATAQALESYKNVLAGKTADGLAYAVSQRLALLTEKTEHLVEGIKVPSKVKDIIFEAVENGAKLTERNASKFGLPGKVVGAAAGVAVTIASGNASASTLTEAGLNGASNGLGTLVIGEGSGRNRLCQIFGDVVVPGAVGVGTGLVATPVAGMAAGTAASVALSEPSTRACNNFAQKLGL